MSLKKWFESTNYAIEGILHAARTERHVRYHFISSLLVLLVSYALGVSRVDFLFISVAVILVLLAEMLNTAVEYVVDLLSPEYSEKARIAKDVSAGAVLITAFGSAVLGYIILYPYLTMAFEKGLKIAKHSRDEIALISIIFVLIAVIMLKSYTGRGHPLRGGMPSGHTAVAFSAWVATTFISNSFKVSLITLALAVIVAQSRVVLKVHTTTEVIAGAVLGSSITLVLFLIFLP